MALGVFHTFLTTLRIGSVIFSYYCLLGRRWAFAASTLCGTAYLLVNALDLGNLFPGSPQAMSSALFVIEAE